MNVRVLPQLIGIALAIAPRAWAHPPTSLVMDSRGVVYYSDLEQVWMIRPDGTKRIAVPDVHTHELWIDSEDNLYGEDVKNVGDVYRHRVWVLSPGGSLGDVIPWRSRHPVDYDDYGFVRDASGQTYILVRDERRIDVLRDGQVVRSIGLDHIDGFIHWTTLDRASRLYVGVGADVYRVQSGSGEVVRIATGIVERAVAFFFVHDRHAMMGMWTDSHRNVFVAVYSGQVVKRISADGEVSTVYRSRGMWSPSGGLAAADGSLWILETSAFNKVRVVRLAADGKKRVY